VFRRTADVYDAVYRAIGKDYAAEAGYFHGLIAAHKQSEGNDLLDVACGTGAHLEHFSTWYRCRGLELDPDMVELARTRVPGVPIHAGDMVEFDLADRFDAVTCLFSSIGYAGNLPRLERAVESMALHLKPGGVLIVEPWFTPEVFIDGHLGSVFLDEPGLKIARMSVARRVGALSIFEFEYLIGTPGGIRRETELHELGLFTDVQYRDAFRRAGLDVHREDGGPMGRGVYRGMRPTTRE